MQIKIPQKGINSNYLREYSLYLHPTTGKIQNERILKRYDRNIKNHQNK